MTRATIQQIADWYASQGWRIAPIHLEMASGGKKMPSYRYTEHKSVQEVGSSDRAEVARMFEHVPDEGGIVIQTGSVSNLAVLDIDNWDHFGEILLDEVDPETGEVLREHDIPRTFTVESQSGGRHYYFQMPEALRGHSALKFTDPGLDSHKPDGKPHGIELLLENRIVFAAPTQVWRQGSVPGDEPVGEYTVSDNSPPAEMPQWMIDWYLNQHASRTYRSRSGGGSGDRSGNLPRAAISAAWEGVSGEQKEAQKTRLLGWVQRELEAIGPNDLWNNEVARVCGVLVRTMNTTPLALMEQEARAFLYQYAPNDGDADWNVAIGRTFESIARTVDGEGYEPDVDPAALDYFMRLRQSDEEAFWTSTPPLRHIQALARSRGIAPEGVLATVLQDCLLRVPYDIYFESYLGEAALNTALMVTARSGGGKGVTTSTAGSAFIFHGGSKIRPATPASGEAITDELVSWIEGKKANDKTGEPATPGFTDWVYPHHAALYEWTEVTQFNNLAESKGSNIFPQLMKSWSGEEMGRTRAGGIRITVPEGQYRTALRIHAQPSLARALFTEEALDSGTTSRFLFVKAKGRASDRSLTPPDPMEIVLPHFTENFRAPSYVDDAIEAFQEQGDSEEGIDRLDTHAMLNRCKWAVAFAVLHGRDHITEHDWNASEYLMKHSNETRDMIRKEIQALNGRKALQSARAEGVSRSVAEEAQAERTEQTVRDAVERLLAAGFTHSKKRKIPKSKGHIRAQLRSNQRPVYDNLYDGADEEEFAAYEASKK